MPIIQMAPDAILEYPHTVSISFFAGVVRFVCKNCLVLSTLAEAENTREVCSPRSFPTSWTTVQNIVHKDITFGAKITSAIWAPIPAKGTETIASDHCYCCRGWKGPRASIASTERVIQDLIGRKSTVDLE